MARERLQRKVIHIGAQDSPNVRRALEQIAQGLEPDNLEVIPGVIMYENGAKGYRYRKQYYDPVKQCISLEGKFYEGSGELLYPPEWLDRANNIQLQLVRRGMVGLGRRVARSMGIDPGEGVSKTTMVAGDEFGIIEIVSKPTPDTSVVVEESIDFINKWKCPPEKVYFDRGGGGKQHADHLRRKGYPVRTIHFGEAATPELMRRTRTIRERKEDVEDRSAVVNRRGEMYAAVRQLLDPANEELGFKTAWGDMLRGYGIPANLAQSGAGLGYGGTRVNGIGSLSGAPMGSPSAQGIIDRYGHRDQAIQNVNPSEERDPYLRLRYQMSLIPLTYDAEGRFYVLPKHPRPGSKEAQSLLSGIEQAGPSAMPKSLVELIGYSPDELDAVVLMVYGLIDEHRLVKVGVY